jgi:hypothetical protein
MSEVEIKTPYMYTLIWSAMFQERPYEKDFDTIEALEEYMDLYVDTDHYSYEIRPVFR